jgi:hypothetical protein
MGVSNLMKNAPRMAPCHGTVINHFPWDRTMTIVPGQLHPLLYGKPKFREMCFYRDLRK